MRISPARRAALRFLARIGRDEAEDWDALLDEALADPALDDPRDRRLFTQLTAGVTRMRGRLDARLLRLTDRPRLNAVVRDALHLALYQLEEMDRLPTHAVIGESVEWVKRRRGRQLAAWTNANLRRFQREGLPGRDPDPASAPLEHAVDTLSYPRWLAIRWIDEFGAEAALKMMDAMNHHPGPCFRWNSLRQGRAAFLKALAAEGIVPESLPGLPDAMRLPGAWPESLRSALERGDLSVQEAASQRIAPLLARGETGRWADLCAAPGGKACHLAELGGDREEVLALDRNVLRLEKVVANAARLGLRRLRALCADARTHPPVEVDGVLLDAPCTALGVLAANPDARWRRAADQIPKLASLQRELLTAAARWPRPGGRLLYAVCTLTAEETREQRAWFLDRFRDYEPEPFGPEELPVAMLSAEGEYFVLPGKDEPVGMYAFRCRRRGNSDEGRP